MAVNRTIELKNVPAKSNARVRGVVRYCNIANRISGKLLEKMRATNDNTPEEPFMQIVIENASVMYTDPQNPTVFENYLAENLWDTKDGEHRSNFSKQLPVRARQPYLAHIDANKPGEYAQVVGDDGEGAFPGDLAVGTEVSLVLDTYETSRKKNPIGVGLNIVLVESETVNYASAPGVNVSGLGIKFSSPLVRTGNPAPAAAPTQATADTAGTDANGLPTINTQGPQAPQGQGYPAQGGQYPTQGGYPGQGYPNQAPQGYPGQGQGYPAQGGQYPTQGGYPGQQGQAPQGYPAQGGYPGQGQAPQGQAPQGQGYPGQGGQYPNQAPQGQPNPGYQTPQAGQQPNQGQAPQGGQYPNQAPQGANPDAAVGSPYDGNQPPADNGLSGLSFDL